MIFHLPENNLVPEKLLRQTLNFWGWARTDARLGECHIRVYNLLLNLWSQYAFDKSFPIMIENMMLTCDIRIISKAIQLLKDLEEYGYISYFPSDKIGMTDRAAIIPLTKKTNYVRLKWNGKLYGGLRSLKSSLQQYTSKANRFKKKKHFQDNRFSPLAPTLGNVRDLFRNHGYPITEALHFFRYHQFSSWQLEDDECWEQAAHYWMNKESGLLISAEGHLMDQQEWEKHHKDEEDE